MRNRYLYCYDISNPKRLRNVHRILSHTGDRVQLSVYECQLTEKEQVHLDERLRKTIHWKEDAVFIVDLGPVAGSRICYRSMGVPFVPSDRDVIVL